MAVDQPVAKIVQYGEPPPKRLIQQDFLRSHFALSNFHRLSASFYVTSGKGEGVESAAGSYRVDHPWPIDGDGERLLLELNSNRPSRCDDWPAMESGLA